MESPRKQITPGQAALLESRGCRCDDWSLVETALPFDPRYYRNVEFRGRVSLGAFSGDFTTGRDGRRYRRGVYDALVEEADLGDDVAIAHIPGGLRSITVGRGAVIDGVYRIGADGESCHGNDVTVDVISETGGREVMINDRLSAPLAYIEAFYRHNALLSKRLREISERYARGKRTSRMTVGEEAEITGCGEITDVCIAAEATVKGASRLVNGSVGRCFVGADVIARRFVIMDGAKVDGGARLDGVLVGRCATVANGFTAHDTLIFTTSHFENGEGSAVFAGPFTTSMHKSTLLIGGLFSFFNAGSGSNQSNHMYKLGPMHQGVLARGCKTGSDSYILWPAAVGAFTTILGRHYSHPDTRDFPFSYLLGSSAEGVSTLLPGAALGSVGLARDVDKWPSRLGEAAQDDPVNFQWLSPLTVGQALRGCRLLKQMKGDDNPIRYNGVEIPVAAIEKGIARYHMIGALFVAGVLRRRILAIASTNPEITPEELVGRLAVAPATTGRGRWADLAGLLLPVEVTDRLIADIIADPEMTLEEIDRRLEREKGEYNSYSWSWLWHNSERLCGVNFASLTAETLAELLAKGSKAAEELEALFVLDAYKEYDPEQASLGFGIDAGEDRQIVEDDFSRARGSFKGQRFVARLRQQVKFFRGGLSQILFLLQSQPGDNQDKKL